MNILTLIPDKHYYETYRNKISENFSSFSSKNGFSGIAIHTIPQLGIPVSVARYLNGRIISSVMMVSDTEVGMVENARKAFSIIGPMTIRSKVRLMTKSSGCDSNGSYGGGGGSPVNPGAGSSGGENEGGGSGSWGNNSGLSDEVVHEIGLNAICKIENDIMIGNYSGYSVKMNASSNPEISLIGAISNIEGVWMSWLPAIKNSPVVLKGFGSILSLAGIFDSGQDAVRTFIAVYNGDVENYSTQDVLDMVSTALNTLGFFACCVPEPMMTKVVGATLSFSGCVVGLIAPMFNYNDLKNTIVRLPLGGGYVTLYIV